MIITYTPEDGEAQRWEWDAGDVRAAEAELMESKAGVPWDQFQMQLLQGMMRARRVLLWHLLRQTHPSLKLTDVDFATSEVKAEFQADELALLRKGIEEAPGVDDEKREQALTMLDRSIAELAAAGDDVTGKALSAPTVSATA